MHGASLRRRKRTTRDEQSDFLQARSCSLKRTTVTPRTTTPGRWDGGCTSEGPGADAPIWPSRDCSNACTLHGYVYVYNMYCDVRANAVNTVRHIMYIYCCIYAETERKYGKKKFKKKILLYVFVGFFNIIIKFFAFKR